MLNHTYTSVKNANIVDCGKKQHIPSQPFPLLRDNFLGEFRTELDKKKVLANLGIVTELSLEWEFIKGDIGRSEALMSELDSRTKYVSELDGLQKSIIEGIQQLEIIVGGEQDEETNQNNRLTLLEDALEECSGSLSDLKNYIANTVDINIQELNSKLNEVTSKVDNITNLIQVSTKEGNALTIESGDYAGLYVPDLSQAVNQATSDIQTIRQDVTIINDSLESFVTKDDLGGGDFNFVNQSEFDSYTESTDNKLKNIDSELARTVKTGEDGHVDTLFVNTISKNNTDGNIKLTDSFELEAGIPLDIRFVVKNLEELHSLKPWVCYPGMGVIVSNQASLYILREPADGVITEEYIKDEQGINWKCPEDLVIEVLTQEEYDKKVEEGSISPHMFYYIHEEIVEEPKREDFDNDESYTEALNKWLRVLQQQYMSAVWGQDIEKLVASKAPNTSVKSLESEIQRLQDLLDSLSGGAGSVNLKDLNDQVQINISNIDNLTTQTETLKTDLSALQTSVNNDYVTKESIINDDPNVDYIFVKKSEFNSYKDTHASEIAKQVTTEKVTVGSNSITSKETSLLLNDEEIALSKQVPVIELVDHKTFEAMSDEDKNNGKYYYVYNDNERYLLYTEFSTYQSQQSNTINSLKESVRLNDLAIGTLQDLSTINKNSLVYAVNELHTYISTIQYDLDTLITGEGIISSMQNAINSLEKEISEKYVTIESISTEDPNVNYIFLKKSEFDQYKTIHDNSLALQITTENLNATSLTLGENIITYEDSEILLNSDKLALQSQIPVIEVIDNVTFENQEKEDDVYYYVYNDTDRYVLDSEFSQYKTQQNQTNATLSNLITANNNLIGDLVALDTTNQNTLVFAINELVSRINDLTNEIELLKQQINNQE